jgi:hypothetical protein
VGLLRYSLWVCYSQLLAHFLVPNVQRRSFVFESGLVGLVMVGEDDGLLELQLDVSILPIVHN